VGWVTVTLELPEVIEVTQAAPEPKLPADSDVMFTLLNEEVGVPIWL
jgi:hypothetical protein